MDGVRPWLGQRPGEFRTIQNQIGFPARFIPPPPQHLPDALDAFEKYMYLLDGFDPLVRAFLVHYQFETIHPFRDGNGRVGRLLLCANDKGLVRAIGSMALHERLLREKKEGIHGPDAKCEHQRYMGAVDPVLLGGSGHTVNRR